MFIVAPSDPIYHIAQSDTMTLCGSFIHGTPDKQRRFFDQRLANEPPKDRVCVLCSKCAELSGDTRSFDERVIYPTIASR
jgi:hypothetical protein